MKPSLMIVDDAKTIHLIVDEMFENEFELLHASDLSEAKLLLEQFKVDLILAKSFEALAKQNSQLFLLLLSIRKKMY